MSSYQQLAGAYDELTWDVGYEKRTFWKSCSAAAASRCTRCWTWLAAPGP